MEDEPPSTLTFLHFNDAYNIQPNSKGEQGFLNFYDFALRKRKELPESLLIFSGDCFAPSKLSRVYKGEQMAHCISQLGIDVACYGNHDFDFSPQQVQKLVSQCKCPWLLSNIKYISTGKALGDGLEHYITKHQGVKIGFIGLAGPDFIGRLISNYKDKLKYLDINEHASKICKKLRGEGCELIVALCHCRQKIDEALARAVPEIDIILGGHDHHKIMISVNKTPIIKSGSDFEYLSVIKLTKHDKVEDSKASTVMNGNRWNFSIETLKVPKAQNPYPELQLFIQKSVKGRVQYDQTLKNEALRINEKREMKKNRPEPSKAIHHESDWFIQYGFLNNRPTVTLKAGLSAQICFAKYIAFKKKCFYLGYRRVVPTCKPNFIEKMLNYVHDQIKTHENNGNSVLYSPGICNVPYLIETTNMVYLPSHFLVGVNNISDLQALLEYSKLKGYQCYAVLGYDPFFKTKLCAWIKFIEPPPQYLQIIRQLKIMNVVMMSVHDQEGENHGAERNCRLISSNEQERKGGRPEPGDIYINFIKEDKEEEKKKEIEVFKKIIQDRPPHFWLEILERPICPYIHDWQSGIDCIDGLQTSFNSLLPDLNIRYFKIVHPDSWALYMTAFHLGKTFVKYNYDHESHPVQPKGVVLNQYIMSNPTYELNYGYLPILYWQFYPKNEGRILGELSEEEKGYKRWLNIHKGTHLRLIEKDSVVIQTDHEGKELGLWVTKYAPKEYQLRYMPFDLFLEEMGRLKVMILC